MYHANTVDYNEKKTRQRSPRCNYLSGACFGIFFVPLVYYLSCSVKYIEKEQLKLSRLIWKQYSTRKNTSDDDIQLIDFNTNTSSDRYTYFYRNSTRSVLIPQSITNLDAIARKQWIPFSSSDSRPRILITGGCGFVGGHLLPKLLKRYPRATVKVVDNLWRGTIKNIFDEDQKPYIDIERDLIIADLTDERVSDHVTKNVDLVIHLADIVAGINYVFKNQHFIFQTNMRINMNVIHSAKRNGVSNFVYTGTACSFPKHLQSSYQMTAISENKTYPANPESAYGWSKLMGEYELNIAKDPGTFNVGIVRFHNLYGDRIAYDQKRSQALPSLVRKAIKYPKEPVVLWGSGKQYRDFLHVSDAVDGILATIERGMNKGAIQIGTGLAINLQDAADAISRLAKKIMNKEIKFTADRGRTEGDIGRVAELTRAKTILNWTATVSFQDGLEQMFLWIMKDMRVAIPSELTKTNKNSLLHVSNTRHDKNSEIIQTTRHTTTSTVQFNLTAKLNLWQNSESGYLGNQMFIFQSTVAIAKVHGMRPVFSRNQLSMLNDVFDIFNYTAVKFNISLIDGDEPKYKIRHAESWKPGKKYIKQLQNTKLQTYLQNIGHMQYIQDKSGVQVNPADFYRIRPKYVKVAEKILPGVPKCVALHVRFFPQISLSLGHNKCPTTDVLQKQVDKVATIDKCLIVFSNDINRAKHFVSAPCVHYVNPGVFETSRYNEVHPVGQLHEAARDFAALTMCEDLITTCGTFGALAAMLHKGKGNVFWFPDDYGLMHFKEFAKANAWIPYR